MHFLTKTALLLALSFSAAISHAALTPDRTRIIYNADMKSISLNINNDNKKLPFLAQSWIEDSQHKKVNGPLVVMPPLQRINAGERSLVRIATTAGVAQLPQDRETLFYFNLREIPPRPEKSNVMQIALQSQLKLFYRPKAIVPEKAAVWQDQLLFNQTSAGVSIENPTPYYITLSSMTRRGQKAGGGAIGGFKPVMVAPKSTEKLALTSRLPESFVITYINDYGGQPELKFTCRGGQVCRAETEQQ
ncbi:molecular chaperone [Enterobacter asburiae]|uniref:fimbrial biogenesis chaperone n=1 Tax=Scandinavium sp. UTDF21-P1B TaxID=3446379 RepID=UPI0034736086